MIRSQLLNRVENVSSGEAKANDGFHSIQIRNCQNASTMAIASSFGHADFQIRRPRDTRGATRTSSASRPDVSARSSTAMPAHFLLEAIGDCPRLLGDLGRVEAAGSVDGDRILLDDATGSARQQDHPIAEAYRLSHVVGHENDAESGLAPEALELVVQHV